MGEVLLTVEFHETTPTYPVALFLVRQKADWTGEVGRHHRTASFRCGDEGHALAYKRAILRESPPGVEVTYRDEATR